MTKVVIDASTALAWRFRDEASDYADAVLVVLEGKPIIVPAIWGLEIANAILVGERRKRLGSPEIRRFTTLLDALPLTADLQPLSGIVNATLSLARKNGLSAYDAAYLALAIRQRALLATLDGALQKAAKRNGVELFTT